MVLSKALLAASRRPGLRRAVTGTPVTRGVVDRFVAGETLDDALGVVRTLTGDGLAVTLDHLGEDVDHPRRGRRAARRLPGAARPAREPLALGRRAEVSVKLSAVGQALPGGGDDMALELRAPGRSRRPPRRAPR